MSTNYQITAMQADDWAEVAELIRISTNQWYEANGKPPIFTGDPAATRLFCEVYEALDPGCCLIARHSETGRIGASCFYHPRETHFSLGIMNVHPEHFGQKLARLLLNEIIAKSEAASLPLRLVSSAMNLDSFSLYNKAGFVPTQVFQDMLMPVPEDGLACTLAPPLCKQVREATTEDLDSIVALEQEISGISRRKDYEHFLQNSQGIWKVLVCEAESSDAIDGVLVSVAHPGSRMLGPGVMRNEEVASALIFDMLQHHRGETPVWLVPSTAPEMTQTLYRWGAKNCELHLAQVRGEVFAVNGIVMPTFMPETG